MLFWNSLAFLLIQQMLSTDVDNLISGSSAFSKSSLNIWNSMVHVLLKPYLENFENYFASMWEECNCVVVWTFFGIGMKTDPFLVLWPLLSFPNLLTYWVQHFHRIIFWSLKLFNWNSITSTSFVWKMKSSGMWSPTWFHIPGYLALGEWLHHCDYLGLVFLALTK